MCSFPKATITNYHKFGDLKQQILILSWFRGTEFQNQGIGTAVLLLKTLGENPFFACPNFWWLQLFLGL
jgi:hypothetical protein